MAGIPHGMFGMRYRAVGDALYCPDCVKSWEERNGVPFDEQYARPGTLFARWWNRGRSSKQWTIRGGCKNTE